MDKEGILEKIKEIAARNQGNPPGSTKFSRETGVRHSEWYGVYWENWGDALQEAGFSRNVFQQAYDGKLLLDAYLRIICELGKVPTEARLRLYRRNNPGFPDRQAFQNGLGPKNERLKKVLEFAKLRNAPAHIIECIADAINPDGPNQVVPTRTDNAPGRCYLLRMGKSKQYKIGASNDLNRRINELDAQTPEPLTMVHCITTDGPYEVERYWKRRWVQKKKRNEWFELSPQDVRAFKRRKTFMWCDVFPHED